jgi:hypothetical protein
MAVLPGGGRGMLKILGMGITSKSSAFLSHIRHIGKGIVQYPQSENFPSAILLAVNTDATNIC